MDQPLAAGRRKRRPHVIGGREHVGQPLAAGRRIYRARLTSQIVGLCDMQLRRMEAAGVFPKRVKLNPNGGKRGATGHYCDEVDKWLDERKRSREAAHEPEAA